MARRRKPSDPAAIAIARERRAEAAAIDAAARRHDPSRWEEERLTGARKAALEQHGATVETDFRGRLKHAHKADVFATLLERGGLTREQHDAARRLQKDMATNAGLDRAPPPAGTLTDGAGDSAAVTQRMVDAGRRVARALQMVGPPSSRLLAALLDPAPAVLRTMAVMRVRCTAKDCRELNEPGASSCRACAADLALHGHEEALHVDEDWRAIVARITGETQTHAQAAMVRLAAQGLVDVYALLDRPPGRAYAHPGPHPEHRAGWDLRP